MGATNCPETPRQKMISMMYLVYTALLALNVSVQILDGYKLVQGSLESSMDIANGNYASMENRFQAALAQNPGKVKEWNDKLQSMKASSDSLCDYINDIKRMIIAGVDNGNKELYKDASVADTLSTGGLGDLNIASEVWTFKLHGGPGKGSDLEDKINNFSNFVAGVYGEGSAKADTAKIKALRNTFDMKSVTKDGIKHTWSSRVFEDMPAIASLTMLTKTQNDIRNTQAEVASWLYNQIDAGDFRVNKIQAIAYSENAYVLRGGKYEANIILAAMDSTKKPEILVGGTPLGPDGKYVVACSSVGNKTYSGVIKMKKPDGTTQDFDFKGAYTVGEPTATISPDMLNVVYAGYPNPMSVSVPGVSMSDVSVTFTNCQQNKKSDGTYVIVPHSPGKNCDVVVTAKIGGKPQQMGKKSFRILPLPPPLAFLKGPNGATFGGGSISKSAVMASTEVIAQLNSDLLKNVKYTVLRFDMKSFDSMGNVVVTSSQSGQLTDAMRSKIRSLAPGKTFYISGTQAKGPDGKTHRLPAVEVSIK
ncbi:MAG: gliding motility protein GldM [Bacteroidales bacterium]|nr:gliding motility protein GldM [Candidatus Physcocola equi]